MKIIENKPVRSSTFDVRGLSADAAQLLNAMLWSLAVNESSRWCEARGELMKISQFLDDCDLSGEDMLNVDVFSPVE